MKKATRQQTKNHNTRLILKTIYDRGDVSRADIARITSLTRPTVSAIVAELMDDRFVQETGQGPSAGGKRPTLLNIIDDAYQLIAVDLGSDVFRGAVVNLRGAVLERVAFPRNGRIGDGAVNLAYTLIDTLRNRATAQILGIGIGTPGLVNPHQGVIKQAVNLGWQKLPLRSLLEARYQLPIYLANDSHMAALAEYTFGAERTSQNLILIKIGRGIGAGIVINGQLLYGDGFAAGEIGHVVIADQGAACSCGNDGCLETVTSTRAILRRAALLADQHRQSRLAQDSEVTWQSIVAALHDGDPVAEQLVVAAGTALGVAIANLIGSFNIHHIVISGRVSRLGELFLQAARSTAQRRVLPAMAADSEILFSQLGSDIVMLGSSAMILKQELGII